MIMSILGAARFSDDEEEEGCHCICECYPHPRDSAYSNGYSAGTADGAWVPSA